AFIDLPFAIPTLVTGVMLVLLYGPQTSAGMFIQEKTGEQILYAPPGILLALLFVGYPFVIRAVQPVLLEMDIHQEEAAYTLGAYSWGTFWRVILPTVRPAILTGALLSFARALGEFGAIIIVAGNLPMKSQTATVYIYAQVEGGNMAGASSVSLLLIFIALALAYRLVVPASGRGWALMAARSRSRGSDPTGFHTGSGLAAGALGATRKHRPWKRGYRSRNRRRPAREWLGDRATSKARGSVGWS
ncbi:ABC transporter permease subunit, partial [bacterium]